jgi:hypothetical protein
MDEAIANALRVFRASVRPQADVHVVTNVFNADLQWMQALCEGLDGLAVRWFVFNKDYDTKNASAAMMAPAGPCVTVGWHVRDLPNVGREGHSWLTYIQTGVFAPTNVFLQGRPHASMESITSSARAHRHAQKTAEDMHPLHPILCHMDEYYDLPFLHAELEQLRAQVPSASLCHSFFGEFIASGQALEYARKQHGAFIGDVMLPALEIGNDPPMGHALERMWLALLTRPAYAR